MPRHILSIRPPVFILENWRRGASGTERTEGRKITKYSELVASGNFPFMPAAVEALDTLKPSALAFGADIEGQLATESQRHQSVKQCVNSERLFSFLDTL